MRYPALSSIARNDRGAARRASGTEGLFAIDRRSEPMATDYVIVLTTLPASADCAAFASALVTEHLAACVNVLPEMQSTYWWDDKVQQDHERQVIIKTTAVKLEDLQARIFEMHPYEVPEILVIRVDGGDEAYLNWVAQATR
jgi:periplasmic divalent cation tolerance protein